MFYMAIVVNQKSQQAGIPLSPKQTCSIVGSLLYIKAFLSGQGCQGSCDSWKEKPCEKAPMSSQWAGINSDFVCTSQRHVRRWWGLTLIGEHRAEKKETAVFGTWNLKRAFPFFLVSSSQPQACTLFPSCPQFTENYLSNMLGNPIYIYIYIS